MKKSELEEDNDRLRREIETLNEEIYRLEEPSNDKKTDIDLMCEELREGIIRLITKFQSDLNSKV